MEQVEGIQQWNDVRELERLKRSGAVAGIRWHAGFYIYLKRRLKVQGGEY